MSNFYKMSSWTKKRRVDKVYKQMKTKILKKKVSKYFQLTLEHNQTSSDLACNSNAETSGNMNQTNNADAFQSNPVACPSLNDLATSTNKTLFENYGAVSNFHRIHCKTKDCQFETESNFDDDNFCHEVNEKVLPILLEVWAVQNCITHNALRDLLCLLHKLHPNLPKDPRTLFSLSYEFTIDNQYYHFGIASTLSHQFQLKLYSKINLQLNIDGLPLFKSSGISNLWPIIALIEENHKFEMHIQPFVIGVYAGDRKPSSAV